MSRNVVSVGTLLQNGKSESQKMPLLLLGSLDVITLAVYTRSAHGFGTEFRNQLC